MSAKVKMLKDVRFPSLSLSFPLSPSSSVPLYNTELTSLFPQITLSIGHEIRESTSLADSMNDSFEGTRIRLKGTMSRMLRMAERTGVGWKVWVLFLLAVWGIFAWVWLF